MDIRAELEESLWTAIQTRYESSDYKGAILDALYYLSDIIREKTGLQSDGLPLIGEAFGGNSPKLRVNPLQTRSDKNVQKGTQSLLEGLFQSIRNPRSHEKHTDTKETAGAIIVFVNYLLSIIGASKGMFSKTEFLGRVFDTEFVDSPKYAQLLVDEIPPRYRFEVMVDVYRRKEELELSKLARFTEALLAKFEDSDLSKMAKIVSDELKTTYSNEPVRLAANMFPRKFWTRLDESAKMRNENRFIESIEKGEYDAAFEKCVRGAFGTWCCHSISSFVMIDECILALILKLRKSKKEEQDYVFSYFSSELLSCLDTMDNKGIRKLAVTGLVKGMRDGDKRFYDLSDLAIKHHAAFWEDELKEAFSSFQEAGEVSKVEANDIPFD